MQCSVTGHFVCRQRTIFYRVHDPAHAAQHSTARTHSPPICAQINPRFVSSRRVATQQAPAAGRGCGCVCVLPARALPGPCFRVRCVVFVFEFIGRTRTRQGGRRTDEQGATDRRTTGEGLVTCMCIQCATELRVASLVRRVAMQRNAGSGCAGGRGCRLAGGEGGGVACEGGRVGGTSILVWRAL
jgi:hypothetical protein